MAQGEGCSTCCLCVGSRGNCVQQCMGSLTLYRGAGVEISPSPKRWEREAAAKGGGPGAGGGAPTPPPFNKTLTLGSMRMGPRAHEGGLRPSLLGSPPGGP